jgi:hypothetical protein
MNTIQRLVIQLTDETPGPAGLGHARRAMEYAVRGPLDIGGPLVNLLAKTHFGAKPDPVATSIIKKLTE